MTTRQLLKTPLVQWHEDNQGRMVDFTGWAMPVQYGSVITEHHQTRQHIGMFDVSHMGRFFFSGAEIGSFLDSLTTRRIKAIAPGKVRYSLLTNDAGMILDDVLVYKLAANGPYAGDPQDDDAFYMMVVNAGNRSKIYDWLTAHIPAGQTISIDDRTESSAMIAVQGPQANALVERFTSISPDSLNYYEAAVCQFDGHDAIVSRTGYTGEDGCELIVDAANAVPTWETLHAAAVPLGGGAAGLAARDTLRLEAAMPLYGHELSEDINAAQTALRFAINLKDREFCGKPAIAAAMKNSDLPVRVGIELSGKRPAREGCEIMVGDQSVGQLTSGTLSPTLQRPIAMGYIQPQYAAPETSVQIDIRGKRQDARVVAMPFYQRDRA